MNFIKKHYEKILLGAVLAGLVVVAAILLPFKIRSEETDLQRQRQEIVSQPLNPLAPLKLGRSETGLKRLQDPAKLNFAATPHNLFNPVPWQKAPDGRLLKVPQTGREIEVQITKVAPLYLTVTLSQEKMGASGYLITFEKETEATTTKRKISGYVALNVKPARLPLILREVIGPPEEPSELILELSDTVKRISVAPGRPYRQVDGYIADLKSENKPWPNKREGDRLVVGGEDYTIERINLVATNQFEVILSAKSTLKRSTIKFETKADDPQKAASKPNAAP